jgi:hypothetical protein
MLASLPWRIILPVLGALLALWGWGEHREGQGRAAERGKWEAVQAKAAAKAATLAQERQAAVDRAASAEARSATLLEALRQRGAQQTKVYYAQNPASNVACLSADRLRHIADSDAAAASVAKAAGQRDE